MKELVFDFKKQHSLASNIGCKHKQEDPGHKNIHKKRITLDLHGCSVIEAKAELQILLQQYTRKKGISVLIITGKGLNSGNKGPVIKNLVKDFLQEQSIQWKLAPPHKGGEGALIAML